MILRVLSFRRLVRMQAQAVQGATGRVWSLGVGSVLRAVFEANAGLALWLQWLVLLVLQATRAATSSGRDLDTFGADYGFARLQATSAVGIATFSRASAGLATVVPVGATIRTVDGAQSFVVALDTANAAYTQAGYALAAGATSVSVPVKSLLPGSGGNIQAGALGLLTTAIPGVDAVSNAAPFAGGLDTEPDPAFRARFVQFVDSRARATLSAVGYAVTSLQQGLAFAVSENVATDGSYRPGFFTVTIDDGSGTPPSSLLTQVYGAVDAVRPVGTAFAVVGPQVVQAVISCVITAAPGYDKAALIPLVAGAVLDYVDSLSIGQPLSYGRLFQVAFSSSPGVVNVQSLVVNGGAADIGGAPFQVVRSTSSQIAVN